MLVISGAEAACTQVRQYHPPATHKQPTMDDLPIPQGSWQAAYDAKQRKYNIHLISGVLIFGITIGVVSMSS
ncbi:hypothetical protein PR048_020101 [Dryococelus australis]|uniref:Deltamethrin resistance protein prag01 domain-containing protein n=1 Tax=Dryococelus australis TaxID=614101 RepID=A0ABQ9H5D2_9NEOP|nr:hypothetical protein PR048_020101 [Dryococelus australis]